MPNPPGDKRFSLSDADIVSQRSVSRRGVLAVGVTAGVALSKLLGAFPAYGQAGQPKTVRDNDKGDRSTGTADSDPNDPAGSGRRSYRDADPTDRAPSDKRREPAGLPSSKPDQQAPKE